MNICLFSNGYPPEDGGGIASYSATLAEGLRKKGHIVTVMAKSRQADRVDTVNGIEVHRFLPRYIPRLEYFLPGLACSWYISAKIKALDKVKAFDIIEFPNWEGLGSRYLLSLRRKPVVTRLHTAFFETLEIDGRSAKGRQWPVFVNWMEKLCVKKSDVLVSSAAFHRDLITRRYKLTRDSISLIALGTRTFGDRPARKTERPNGDYRVLYVSRLEKRKGTLTLLHAIPGILEKFPLARFTFIGADRRHAPGGLTFQKYFEKKYPSHRENTEFLGFLSPEELARYYSDSDLFVVPSLSENFGLVFIEAMSFGLPVIACRATAVPEVVKDGATGILIEPGSPRELTEAVCGLLGDNNRRMDMGQKAYAWVRSQFSHESMVEKTEQLYRDVIGRFGRKAV